MPFLCTPQKRFMNSTKEYQKSILGEICIEFILMNFREIFYFLDTLKYTHERVVEYQIKWSPHRFSFKRRSEKSGDIRGSLVPIIGTLGQKLKSLCLEYHTRQCMIVSSGLKLATSRNEPTKLGEGNVSSRVCLSTGGPMWPLPRMHWTSLYRPQRPCPPHTGPCYASTQGPGPSWAKTGNLFKLVLLRTSLYSPPPMLTSGGCLLKYV